MYSKIALGNVRKSFKDYAIYFLTLTFAVCIFYCFNSIESQKAVLDMSASQAGYMESINQLLSMVSVFVVFILGGLILYANNFLIKKRKKELGVYMTLGMGKSKISNISLRNFYCWNFIISRWTRSRNSFITRTFCVYCKIIRSRYDTISICYFI